LSEPAEDFCSPKIYNTYLRVYALLLGNFDVNDYRESKGMTILFVMFTLLGVVILLNVLIAVIGDTYHEATLASRRRFGRTRIIFVAQHEALERFLRPGLDASERTNAWNSTRGLLYTANHVGRWFVLITLIATAMNSEVYLVLRAVSLIGKGKDYLIIIGISVLAVVLTIALWIIVCFSLEKLIRNYAPDRVVHVFDVIDTFTIRHTGVIGTRLFGLKNNGDIGETEEEWAGRLLHMEQMFDRTMTNAEKMFERTLSEAKEELSGELLAFEKRIYENQARRDGRGGGTNGTEL
jgi:Tfp pilus assembly protein PilE